MMIKLVSKEKGAYWATLDGEKIPRFIIRDAYDAAESGWYYNMSDRTIWVKFPVPKKDDFEVVISKEKFDLLILDIMIPKIDGYGVCEFVKKQSNVPVIFLSALGDEKSMVKGYDSLADDYVTKPFEPEYLRARVHNILTLRSQLEQSYRERLMRLEPQKGDEPIPGDAFLAKLLGVMEKQLDNNTLTVDDLVDEMGMGRTVFFNKLKSLTGLSPVEFIREMRIKRAAQLLEDRQYNITEVTYMVGMNDSRYFAKCFKNTYGVTPSEYRRAALEKEEK
jgi:YesN/AraC family two-component response regulator